MTSYLVGRLLPHRKVEPRAIQHVRRYGAPVTLLAWLPVVGDALCVAAGWLRIHWSAALGFMAAGRLARYLVVAFLHDQHSSRLEPMKGWRERAQRLKTDLFALYLAARHPETPWYAKLVVAGFVAYAVTPVDLFPDAIPVLGIVDDLIFVPLAIAAAVRLVPAPVLAECRNRAQERVLRAKTPWLVVAAVWAALAAAGIALSL